MFEATITVDLKDSGQEGRTVVIRNPKAMSLKKFRAFKALADTGDEESGMKMLRSLIVSSTAQDEDGADIADATSEEGFESLPLAVFLALNDAVGKALDTTTPKASATV